MYFRSLYIPKTASRSTYIAFEFLSLVVFYIRFAGRMFVWRVWGSNKICNDGTFGMWPNVTDNLLVPRFVRRVILLDMVLVVALTCTTMNLCLTRRTWGAKQKIRASPLRLAFGVCTKKLDACVFVRPTGWHSKRHENDVEGFDDEPESWLPGLNTTTWCLSSYISTLSDL